MSSDSSVAVASLGLFILDRFEWRTQDADGSLTVKKREDAIIGGGGTYAVIGSRVWLPAARVGILVDRGYDWPAEVERELETYGKEMWVYREKPDAPTTRALNLYTGEHRDFEYLTPRVRLEPQDLPAPMRTSQYLHFVCSPTRARVITSLLSPPLNPTPHRRPQCVYEPIPDRCVPDELEPLRAVLPLIDVFSPNHEEAGAFFGWSTAEVARGGRGGIEAIAKRFLDAGAKDVVLIRSGPLGAYAVRRGEERGVWVPAYHSYEDGRATGKVVDVTGAGNSFLASFVIEQFGLPKMQLGEDGTERWNGVDPATRLAEMQARQAEGAR
ncbi:hypothetical protein Rhopal_003834-T1 [Rhodotorula paludigena]|uniref:Carbohydrate kinase PfkB domain-containing protein n=1 Tax=Rhodotorula paludigena TaxID=86838 RepID=A0AAV5GLT2_9BASI|nr:hypothetical protein Rhopal_003834-T1 [Rhodotorula paludigena]